MACATCTPGTPAWQNCVSKAAACATARTTAQDALLRPYLAALVRITAQYQQSTIEVVLEEVDKIAREINAQSTWLNRLAADLNNRAGSLEAVEIGDPNANLKRTVNVDTLLADFAANALILPEQTRQTAQARDLGESIVGLLNQISISYAIGNANLVIGASPADTSTIRVVLSNVAARSTESLENVLLWTSIGIVSAGAAAGGVAVTAAALTASLTASRLVDSALLALVSLGTKFGASALVTKILVAASVNAGIPGVFVGFGGVAAAAAGLGPIGLLLLTPLSGLALVAQINVRTRSGDYVRPVDRDSFVEEARIELQNLLTATAALIAEFKTKTDELRDNYLLSVRNIIPASVAAQLDTIQTTYNVCVAAAEAPCEPTGDVAGNCAPVPVRPAGVDACHTWQVIIPGTPAAPDFPAVPDTCGWVNQCGEGQNCVEGVCETPPPPPVALDESCLNSPAPRPAGLGSCFTWQITTPASEGVAAICGWAKAVGFDEVSAAATCARDGGTWNSSTCTCTPAEGPEEPGEPGPEEPGEPGPEEPGDGEGDGEPPPDPCPNEAANEAACDARGDAWRWTPRDGNTCGSCDEVIVVEPGPGDGEPGPVEPPPLECGDGLIPWPPAAPTRCVSACTAPCTAHNASGECVPTYPSPLPLHHIPNVRTCGSYDPCTHTAAGERTTYARVSAARLANSQRLRDAGASVGQCLPLAYINLPDDTREADCVAARGVWNAADGECERAPVIVPIPGPCQALEIDDSTDPPTYSFSNLCLSDEICVGGECRPRPERPTTPTGAPITAAPLACPPGTVLAGNGLFCRELTPEERPCTRFDVSVDIRDLAGQAALRDVDLSIATRRCGHDAEPIVFGQLPRAELEAEARDLVQPGLAAELTGYANSAARWLATIG